MYESSHLEVDAKVIQDTKANWLVIAHHHGEEHGMYWLFINEPIDALYLVLIDYLRLDYEDFEEYEDDTFEGLRSREWDIKLRKGDWFVKF